MTISGSALHFAQVKLKNLTVALRVVGAALLLAGTSAQAANRGVLEPTSPWRVDYAQNECRLLRDFGNGENAVTMRLARGSGLDSFDLVVAGTVIPRLPKKLDVSFGLEQQKAEQTVEAYSLAVPGQPFRFIRWFDASPDLLPEVTNAQIVTIRYSDRVNIAMRWTDGKAALKALEVCHLDLLKDWGVDVAALKAAKVRARPTSAPARWITDNDYPSAAARASLKGDVVFQVKVAVDGSVENCVIVQSSLVPMLDEATCELIMRRAKFTPALDQNDQPMIGFYINRVRWLIPE